MPGLQKAWHYTKKKDKFYTERSDEKRLAYLDQIKDVSKKNLVSVDESGIQEYLYKTYGYAIRGEKIPGGVRGSSFTRENLIAAKCGKKILAPMCFTGACDSDLFIFWVKEFLIKELKSGQTVIMDNASFHKSKDVRELIESVGCRLIYLPPYSPDLNPIEKFWAWLKDRIRETAHLFKTLQDAVDHTFKICM
jgi:transposase